MIVDVANPRQPKLLGSVDRGLRVALSGKRLLVADGAGLIITSNEGREVLPGGFVVVDVADPGNPRELGRLDSEQLGEGEYGANVEAVAAFGNYAYLGLSILKGLKVSEFLVVVDVGDPRNPREVARVRLKKGIQDLGVAGKTLYALAEATISRFDLTAPAKPEQLDPFRQGEILRTVFTESGTYAGNWEGLYLVRFGGPR